MTNPIAATLGIVAVAGLPLPSDAEDGPRVVFESKDQRVVVETTAPPEAPVLVVPRPSGPFGLEVRGARLQIRDERAIARLAEDVYPSLRLHNRADFDVAAQAYVDGVPVNGPVLVTRSGVTRMGGQLADDRPSRVTVLVRAAWPTTDDGPRVEPVRPGERLRLRTDGGDVAEFLVGSTVLAAISVDFDRDASRSSSPKGPAESNRWERRRRWRR